METSIKRSGKLRVLSMISTTLMLLFLAVNVLAQNVADSDLSNSAGTNKNWYGSMWFFGVLIALVIVIVIAFARKRKRDGSSITDSQHRS